MELSPEERCERVRMALAEAGYPDADVRWMPYDDPTERTGPAAPSVPTWVPRDVRWRAWLVAGEDTSCWPCHATEDRATIRGCAHDPWASPWPEVAA